MMKGKSSIISFQTIAKTCYFCKQYSRKNLAGLARSFLPATMDAGAMNTGCGPARKSRRATELVGSEIWWI